MAVGPPATGICHTMVRYGVGRCTESEPQGVTPVMFRTCAEPVSGPQTSVRWCHCTRAPNGMGGLLIVEGRTYMAAANTSWPDGVWA